MITRSNGAIRPLSRRRKISSKVAMRSPRIEQHKQPDVITSMVAVHPLDEQMIEADFAEFIDDDERARGRGIAEQAVQDARFSGAKKTCDNRQRERRGRLPSMGCFLVLYHRRPWQEKQD